jgi:DegV family protein with EDD domain
MEVMEDKILLVTDSTAYIPDNVINKYPFIKIVPLTVNFEDFSIEDNVVNNEVFVEKLQSSANLPSSSRPSPSRFIEVFKPAIENGHEVICLTISSKLSGTFESAAAAAKEVGEDKISVIDSKLTVAGLYFLIEQAAEQVVQGLNREEIVDNIIEKVDKIKIYLVPESLEYLKKGGRIGGAKAFLGTIMNIKPVLYLHDGIIDAFDKVRTMKKAYQLMVREMPSYTRRVAVSHLMADEKAEKLKELIEKEAPHVEVNINELGPVISMHVGPGTLGVIYY